MHEQQPKHQGMVFKMQQPKLAPKAPEQAPQPLQQIQQ